MKIVDAICAKGMTGFYFDDQRAIKNGAKADGGTYLGQAVTEGFSSVRQAGESVCIMLILEDGSVAYGDCASVQYSGAGGRDPLFIAEKYIKIIVNKVFPLLIGTEISSFRAMANKIDKLINSETGRLIHTAIRYGVSQALLHAVSLAERKMMAEVVADEYKTRLQSAAIPIFTQSGDSRYINADKMIIKRAGSLPHGLINSVPDKLGYKGEKLVEYVDWLASRVRDLGGKDYNPILHIDVYGTIGMIFENDYGKMISYFQRLKAAAGSLVLRIEGPIDVNEREAQVEALASLTSMVDMRIEGFEIVADEWCNTLDDVKYFADNRAGHMLQIKTPDLGGINNTAEAVLYCKSKGIGAYQGGTCNETDISAKACVHVAMATGPDLILAKPGMGVDEGYMIVYNEMQRILALKGRSV